MNNQECKFYINVPITHHKKIVTPIELLGLINFSSDGVNAIRQYFVDGERQRWWPLTWNEDIHIENGDKFEIMFGPPVEPYVEGEMK